MGNEEINKFIKQAINGSTVVVFSVVDCPWSKLVKKIFQIVEQPIKVYELDKHTHGVEILAHLKRFTGLATVPQVFIRGICVGGGHNVKAYYHHGQLRSMLM